MAIVKEHVEWALDGLWKASAADARRVFVRLAKRDGAVTPEALVKAAVPDSSAIHNDFTWDDEEAGQNWREHQAEKMIRDIRQIKIVVQEDGTERALPATRYLVPERDSNPLADSKRYVMWSTPIPSEVEVRTSRIEKAGQELIRWRERYGDLEEFAPVIEAIDALDAVPA